MGVLKSYIRMRNLEIYEKFANIKRFDIIVLLNYK